MKIYKNVLDGSAGGIGSLGATRRYSVPAVVVVLASMMSGCDGGDVPPSGSRPNQPADQDAVVEPIVEAPRVLPPTRAIRILAEREWDLQRTAADALSRIGPKAIPELTKALDDPEPKTRAYAAWALGRMGPEAVDAVEPLIAALDDADPTVQKNAARAIGQIGPAAEAAVPRLIDAMRESGKVGEVLPAQPE